MSNFRELMLNRRFWFTKGKDKDGKPCITVLRHSTREVDKEEFPDTPEVGGVVSYINEQGVEVKVDDTPGSKIHLDMVGCMTAEDVLALVEEWGKQNNE